MIEKKSVILLRQISAGSAVLTREVFSLGRCIRLFALNAAKNVKFPLSLKKEGLSIAETAIASIRNFDWS